eukprot:841184-Pyramimonas_sp.AAC.2
MGAPPTAPVAVFVCFSRTSTPLRGPIKSPTKDLSGGVRMRPPHPVQRSRGSIGNSTEGPVAPFLLRQAD